MNEGTPPYATMKPVRPPINAPRTAPTARATSHAYELLRSPLPELRLIRVSGDDRARFLQGQLTQDVGAAGRAAGAVYGWATAQGRLLATGLLLDSGDALWLTVPAELAEAVARRLRMFILRARVAIGVGERIAHGLFARGPAPLGLGGTTLGPCA